MLVLASKSAARRALLQQAGLKFACEPALVDERAVERQFSSIEQSDSQRALGLARAKALDVSKRRPTDIVIGADQLLMLEGQSLHHIGNIKAARAQLQKLRGRTHHLISGVVLARNGEIIWEHCETAEMKMRDVDDAELDRILSLEGDDILGSVGAYCYEGPSIQLFEAIKGDYFTILGLPLLALLDGLRQIGPEVFDIKTIEHA